MTHVPERTAFPGRTLEAARAYVKEQHEQYCRAYAVVAQQLGTKFAPPRMRLSIKCGKVAGKYFPKQNLCQYFLPYAMLEQSYDETVCHEVCHGFVKQAMPKSRWHGDMFYFFLSLVYGRATTYHMYDVKRARAFGLVLAQHIKNRG